MAKQMQVFENQSSRTMEVHVEAYPDRSLLKPRDMVEITYEHDGEGPGLHTIVHEDGGLQIYLDNFDSAVVLINGIVVSPWSQ